MFIRNFALAGIVAIISLPLCLSAAALDKPRPTTWQQIDPTWTRVSNDIIHFAGEEKQKLLAELAFAAVASEICKDLPLDKEKFQNEFDGKLGKVDKTISPAETTQYGEKVLIYFGIYMGILGSAGSIEHDNFCNAAYEVKPKSEGRFWLSAASAGK